jgi:regulator of replication initiation timing
MAVEPLLRVLVGANRLPAPSGQPTLIVEADTDRVEKLRLQLTRGGNQAPCLIRQAVLAARPGQLTWYRYNDGRLNGTVPLALLQDDYPNLLLIQEDKLQAQTLADVLEEWPASAEGQPSIALTLSQGDPVDVLEGAGAWQQRIQQIVLQTPRAQELWLQPCQTWCLDHGFVTDPLQPLRWTLDPLSHELSSLRNEVGSIREQLTHAMDQANRLDITMNVLRHVFPYHSYSEKRPDLADLSDEALVDHFINNGYSEGTDLRFENFLCELRQLREKLDREAARNALLDRKSQDTAQQIDMLKDMFSRMMANP